MDFIITISMSNLTSRKRGSFNKRIDILKSILSDSITIKIVKPFFISYIGRIRSSIQLNKRRRKNEQKNEELNRVYSIEFNRKLACWAAQIPKLLYFFGSNRDFE